MSTETNKVDLKSLVGPHILDAVDFSVEQVANWGDTLEDAQHCRFRLDGVVYIAVENPDDGYRSSMRHLLIGAGEMTNVFPPLKVIGRHREKGEGSWAGTDDVLELIDEQTGKTVLEVGTDNIDDYYPGFVASFHPEAMAHNATGAAVTPTDTILALEKALEYVTAQHDRVAVTVDGRLDLLRDRRDANENFSAVCSPLAIRTLLDAHASALRDAERYAAIRSLGWTVNIDHCGDPDSIEVNVACAGNFARKPFDGANELDRIADAARAALDDNTKGAAE